MRHRFPEPSSSSSTACAFRLHLCLLVFCLVLFLYSVFACFFLPYILRYTPLPSHTYPSLATHCFCLFSLSLLPMPPPFSLHIAFPSFYRTAFPSLLFFYFLFPPLPHVDVVFLLFLPFRPPHVFLNSHCFLLEKERREEE